MPTCRRLAGLGTPRDAAFAPQRRGTEGTSTTAGASGATATSPAAVVPEESLSLSLEASLDRLRALPRTEANVQITAITTVFRHLGGGRKDEG